MYYYYYHYNVSVGTIHSTEWPQSAVVQLWSDCVRWRSHGSCQVMTNTAALSWLSFEPVDHYVLLDIYYYYYYYYKRWRLKWHYDAQTLQGHLTNTKTVTCWQWRGSGISILTKGCPEQYCIQLMSKDRQWHLSVMLLFVVEMFRQL